MADIKEILQPLNTSGKPKTIKVGNTYPHVVSAQYTADMRKIIKALAEQVKEIIIPEINTQVKQRDGVRQDGLADILIQINLLKENILNGTGLATEFALKTYTANEKRITNSIERSIGIAVNLPEGSLSHVDDWVANNSLLIRDLQDEYLTSIQKSVANGFTTGKTSREIAKEIQKATGITWRRAKTISRNEIGNLNSQITQERNKELGIEKARWMTMQDERVRGNPGGLYPKARPSHFARDGKTFEWSKGIDGELPGQPINCLPFESKVNNSPFAEIFYRRWYAGELTEIISDDDIVCRVTPNHPVLTSNGFKAAKLINDSDYIVRTFDNIGSIVNLYGKDLIPAIGDVFNSLSRELGGCCVAPASRGYFHGDISDSDVDIIRSDSFLWDNINPKMRNDFYKLGFSRSDMMMCRVFLTSFGCIDSVFSGSFGSLNSVVSRLNLILSRFIVHLAPLELFSFALGSWTYPSKDEMTSDHVSTDGKVFRDSVFAFSCLVHGCDPISRKISYYSESKHYKLREINSEMMGGFNKIGVIGPDIIADSGEAGLSKLRLAKVSKVRTVDFSGHVYNLQTISGDYSAETSAMSNCRCWAESVIDLD